MKTVGIDAPEVTNDEAVELCVYHLRMAQTYFEATEDSSPPQIKEEYDRMTTRGYPGSAKPTGYYAAMTWIDAITGEHEGLKERYGD